MRASPSTARPIGCWRRTASPTPSTSPNSNSLRPTLHAADAARLAVGEVEQLAGQRDPGGLGEPGIEAGAVAQALAPVARERPHLATGQVAPPELVAARHGDV